MKDKEIKCRTKCQFCDEPLDIGQPYWEIKPMIYSVNNKCPVNIIKYELCFLCCQQFFKVKRRVGRITKVKRVLP